MRQTRTHSRRLLGGSRRSLGKIDAAMAKRDTKRGEIDKRKPSAKEARAYIAACNKGSAAGEAAEESDYSFRGPGRVA